MTDLRDALLASIEQHDAEQTVYVPQRFFYGRGEPICWSEQGDPTEWSPRLALTPIDVSFARVRRAFRQRFIKRYRRG